MREFAIASLVIGIISFISLGGMEKAIVAIIFGVLALKRMQRSGEARGKRLAEAGIMLGIFSIIATIFFIVKFLPQIEQKVRELQSQESPIRGGGDLKGSEDLETLPETKLY